MLDNLSEFRTKKILVTGHTGFKGTWLARTLVLAGAEVHGLALLPEHDSIYSKFDSLGIESSTILDIRNNTDIKNYFTNNSFDAVFHLAAQPLVLKSYKEPLQTFETNVLGTANLLDSIVEHNAAKWVLVVTTDKVYKNRESRTGYREEDALGGKDPYSASKSAAEMVVNAWRAVAEQRESKVLFCVARAGNVIGGGDIAKDRLIPDLIRSFHSKEPAVLRNPNSLRPWQHVLDPINGYLRIGQELFAKNSIGLAYNFGPSDQSKLNVESMAKIACSLWEGNSGYIIRDLTGYPQESQLLWLSSDLAKLDLNWSNKLDAQSAIQWTIRWERESLEHGAREATDSQINKFFEGEV